jgi:hypothetical protein
MRGRLMMMMMMMMMMLSAGSSTSAAKVAAVQTSAITGGSTGGGGRSTHDSLHVRAGPDAEARDGQGTVMRGSIKPQNVKTPRDMYIVSQRTNDRFKKRLHPCDERDLLIELGDKHDLGKGWKSPYARNGVCGNGCCKRRKAC